MDRLFPLVSSLLSSSGLFYLVTVAENKPGMDWVSFKCHQHSVFLRVKHSLSATDFLG